MEEVHDELGSDSWRDKVPDAVGNILDAFKGGGVVEAGDVEDFSDGGIIPESPRMSASASVMLFGNLREVAGAVACVVLGADGDRNERRLRGRVSEGSLPRWEIHFDA